MMRAAAITALCIPILSAAPAASYKIDLQQSQQRATTWQQQIAQVATELEELGVEVNSAAAQAEIPETEDTVAVADQGLLFDTANSRIIYLGNVRLRDARAHINASEQLHIYLQDLTEDKKGKEDAPPAPLADATLTEGIATEEAEAEQPAPDTTESRENEATEKPAAPVAEAVEAELPAESAATIKAPATEPARIDTHSAIADSINNAILLYAPAGGKEILMQQGQNMVRITPGATTPARILADPEGNILLEGGEVNVQMVDEEGGITTLKTTGGLAYYHAASHTLHAPGSTIFTHPDGSLQCTQHLCITLVPAEQEKETKAGFMSQFTGLRFDGISTATAQGTVVMTGPATEGRAALRAEGDTLTYDGKTGECSLTGQKSRLCYGSYDVYTNQGVHLLANGDIELHGSDIHGTYERESDEPGKMLQGTFKANAPVVFRADHGTITTDKGLCMKDAESDFSCTGLAELKLSPKEGASEPERKPGMPNLAIARYGGVSRAKAIGNVTAHLYEPGTQKCTGELKAASLESDMVTGETLLTGEPGQPLIALYEGNRIVSTPAPGQTATMQMLANGDLRLNGATIDATMVNEHGTTTAHCNDYVRLIRAENRLETGSSTKLKAPTAILTTTGSLSARLSGTGEPVATAPKTGFRSFRFNYNGIEEATTGQGCTLRTEEGSMQCTGPVRIVLDNKAKTGDSPMGSVKYATAAGDVALAGKDSEGRLLRATGDLLTIDSATGMKVLSGQRVTLGDAYNTHIITGKGAAIRIDAKNNVKIVGGSHKTHATKVREQLKTPNNQKTKK